MKLKEFLETTEYEKVNIGCEGGSAFFFCGKKNDPRLEEVCGWLEEKWTKDTERRIAELESRIKECEEKLKKAKEEAELPCIMEREVVENYQSIQERNRIIVTIAGHKEGNRWDESEFEKWYAAEKKRMEEGD